MGKEIAVRVQDPEKTTFTSTTMLFDFGSYDAI